MVVLTLIVLTTAKLLKNEHQLLDSCYPDNGIVLNLKLAQTDHN